MANNQQPTVRLSFGPATRPPQAAPIPPSPPPSDSYMVLAENRQYGPASAATIRQWIAEKRIPGDVMVQRAGTNEWKRIAGMPEFAGQVSTPPPSAISQPAATASATAQVAPSNVSIAEINKQLNQAAKTLENLNAALANRAADNNAEEKDILGYLVPMIEHAFQSSPLPDVAKQQALAIFQVPNATYDMGAGVRKSMLFDSIAQYNLPPKRAANYLFANIQNWGSVARDGKGIEGIKCQPHEFADGNDDEQVQLVPQAWANLDVFTIANVVVTGLLKLKLGPPPSQ